eukprot:TRINITY_DN31229_c0_g2_i1.p1 TRINITY_DN31229_c0_g2~~TRINITY_DN31229_c0_g2_i1.p1  ORF type:complete len:180 (-),score=30.50 TRINITY_DN31229_c0_g2_i1:268-807(-)
MAAKSSLPKLVVFDLDACCWYPEMYMLGRGAPFTATPNPCVLKTDGGEEVSLLGDVHNIWKQLHFSAEFADTKVGVASKCDIPEWGRECLQKFIVQDGVSMWDIAGGGALVEIAFSNKQEHIKRLKAKTGIDFHDMLFFDDQHGNIRNVAALGVTSVLTPDGVTADAWAEGLRQHAARS